MSCARCCKPGEHMTLKNSFLIIIKQNYVHSQYRLMGSVFRDSHRHRHEPPPIKLQSRRTLDRYSGKGRRELRESKGAHG